MSRVGGRDEAGSVARSEGRQVVARRQTNLFALEEESKHVDIDLDTKLNPRKSQIQTIQEYTSLSARSLKKLIKMVNKFRNDQA